MKKILLTVLLIMSLAMNIAIGQDKNLQQKGSVKIGKSKKRNFTFSFPIPPDSLDVNVEGMEFTIKENAWLFAILIKLKKEWQVYKRVCYNDSSLHGSWEFITTDSIGLGAYTGYSVYVSRWIHQEATFDGFMNYSNNKYFRRPKND